MRAADLVAAVEGAPYGSPKLNAEVGRYFGTWKHQEDHTWDGDGYRSCQMITPPAYTTRLSDTRLLCSGSVELKWGPAGLGTTIAIARVTRGNDYSKWYTGTAAQPELALASACIQAEEAGR